MPIKSALIQPISKESAVGTYVNTTFIKMALSMILNAPNDAKLIGIAKKRIIGITNELSKPITPAAITKPNGLAIPIPSKYAAAPSETALIIRLIVIFFIKKTSYGVWFCVKFIGDNNIVPKPAFMLKAAKCSLTNGKTIAAPLI